MGGGAGPGPGPWCLGAALSPGGSPACAWVVWVALGMPQYVWVGAGPGAGLVALGPPMCPQVFFLFRVLRRAVGWGGAFPHLGEAWVGLGDGGSQARAAATGVTAWFVCLFFLSFL